MSADVDGGGLSVDGLIPVVLTRCCRDWISPPPGLVRGTSCGFCGEVPVFVELVPADEWPQFPEPITSAPVLPAPGAHPPAS